MHILMVSHDFPPTVGGIAAHVYELSKAMVRSGHRVTVLTRTDGTLPKIQETDGITIHRIRLRGAAPLYGLQTDRKIQSMVRSEPIDLVHIHGMAPLEWLRPLPVPLVYTNHTSGYLSRIQKGGLRRSLQLRRWLRKPDLLLAPSEELLSIPFSVPAQQTYIPNGVDGSVYGFSTENRVAIRKSLGFSDHHRVGILTRRLVPKNGVIHLANAAKFLATDPSLRFLLIGDGPESDAIRQQLSRYMPERFVMTGSLPHSEIIPYYSAADFAVLPSLMEATSISGLEAMASCLPLVGTTVGGIPDLIQEGETGLLCAAANPQALAESIQKLLHMDYREMGRAARKRVETEFDWMRIAEKTLLAYNGVK